MNNTKTQSTIHVVDDDEAVRDSLCLLLDLEGYQVMSYSSGPMFLERYVAGRSECVVMDIYMPGMDGLQLQQTLNERDLAVPVILMTGHGDVSMAVEAMKAGACDFLEKPFNDSALLKSITQCLQRPAPGQPLPAPDPQIQERLSQLTPREREVMRLLATGKANKAVASTLDISPRTVEVHRARIKEKLQADSFADIVRLAFATGGEF
jgi:two-component system response regulator FixJ